MRRIYTVLLIIVFAVSLSGAITFEVNGGWENLIPMGDMSVDLVIPPDYTTGGHKMAYTGFYGGSTVELHNPIFFEGTFSYYLDIPFVENVNLIDLNDWKASMAMLNFGPRIYVFRPDNSMIFASGGFGVYMYKLDVPDSQPQGYVDKNFNKLGFYFGGGYYYQFLPFGIETSLKYHYVLSKNDTMPLPADDIAYSQQFLTISAGAIFIIN